MSVIFYVAAFVALASTVMVVTRRHAVHALLYLIVSLLAVAVIFYVIGAPFVAALEVIIYAGAIMVLFVFVMMMLNLGERAAQDEAKLTKPSVFIGPTVLSLVLAVCFIYMLSQSDTELAGVAVVDPGAVGTSMFSTYLLGVEMVGMLLLAGLVGAFHLGRRHDNNSSQKNDKCAEAMADREKAGV